MAHGVGWGCVGACWGRVPCWGGRGWRRGFPASEEGGSLQESGGMEVGVPGKVGGPWGRDCCLWGGPWGGGRQAPAGGGTCAGALEGSRGAEEVSAGRGGGLQGVGDSEGSLCLWGLGKDFGGSERVCRRAPRGWGWGLRGRV